MANFMTAEEAINKIEDGSDLSDLSEEEDSLVDTDIGDEEDLLSDSNMEDDNNDDNNDGDMWSPWRGQEVMIFQSFLLLFQIQEFSTITKSGA